VTGYALRPDGGFLPRACEFLLSRTWLVRYDARVSGAAAAGRLTALRRVSVKLLFLWVPVGKVHHTGRQGCSLRFAKTRLKTGSTNLAAVYRSSKCDDCSFGL
jgi:predicted ABC-type sugar transport system permease subunit